MPIRHIAALAALLLATTPAAAEIVKLARTDCKTSAICFYWWPKLQPPAGWHQDLPVSYAQGGNGADMLVPDGATFSNAGSVIYAMAVYKARYQKDNPKTKTLADFIADDAGHFRDIPGAVIADPAPLTTVDGQVLSSKIFAREQEKNWDRVAYGEEGDYWLVFTLNAKSRPAFDKAMPVFEKLVGSYRQ